MWGGGTSIEYRASSIEHRVSSIEHPDSGIFQYVLREIGVVTVRSKSRSRFGAAGVPCLERDSSPGSRCQNAGSGDAGSGALAWCFQGSPPYVDSLGLILGGFGSKAAAGRSVDVD